MSLINCPDCDKEISRSAKTCPNCGKELKTFQDFFQMGCATRIFLLVVIIMILNWLDYCDNFGA